MEKSLSEITRKEWIIWQWFDVGEMGMQERNFIRGLERSPDEALEAAEEWDFLQSVKEEDEN